MSVSNQWLEFRDSTIHGTGAFARAAIPADTRLIQYLGERIDKAESVRRCENDNRYIFTLDDQFDIDGNFSWNPARLINHSCAPNCEANLIDGEIWIVTARPISAGEEITFNYGYDLTDYREFPCRCGAPNCAGYMVAEEFFDHIRRTAAPAGAEPVRELTQLGSDRPR